MGGENWKEVVSKSAKKAALHAEILENISSQYVDYLKDKTNSEEDLEYLIEDSEVVAEHLNNNKEVHNQEGQINLDMWPELQENETDKAIEEEHRKNSAPTRSPWMRKALSFYEEPVYTKEDLAIPHFGSITPKDDIIQLEESDIVPIRKGWGICLLGMFAGRFPGKEAVYQLMKKWPAKARVTFHRKGWMFFQFGKEGDLERTRQKGPFSIFGIPLILQPLPEDFRLSKEMEINIPVWIKLVDLEPFFWKDSTIGKIASNIGVPIATDFRTLERGTMDWPRIQVIINAASAPKESIMLRSHTGEFFKQKIQYEYMPKFCSTCKIFGHYESGCFGPEARSRTRQRNEQPARPQAPPLRARSKSISAKDQGIQRPHSKARTASRTRQPSQPPRWKETGKKITYPIVGTYRRTPADPNDYKEKGKGIMEEIPQSPNRFEVLEEMETAEATSSRLNEFLVVSNHATGNEFSKTYEQNSTRNSQQKSPSSKEILVQIHEPQEKVNPSTKATVTETTQQDKDELEEILKNHFVVDPPSNTAVYPTTDLGVPHLKSQSISGNLAEENEVQNGENQENLSRENDERDIIIALPAENDTHSDVPPNPMEEVQAVPKRVKKVKAKKIIQGKTLAATAMVKKGLRPKTRTVPPPIDNLENGPLPSTSGRK